jgi:hypothetical protein
MGPKKAQQVKEGGHEVKEKPLPRRAFSGDDRVIVETMHREEKCREKFSENALYFRKSRNPTTGELTPRDTAEFLIPIERTIQMNLDTEKYLDFDQTYKTTKQSPKMTLADCSSTRSVDVHKKKIDAVRCRKEVLAHELEQMKKVAEYKAQLFTKTKI